MVMSRSSVADARRLAAAVDRLDAVSAVDRQTAAKHVFDVCVYHVNRVRKTYSAQHQHAHGRAPNLQQPSSHLVFDAVHPHIYRITRRLDRAMRYAETSPHPADAAALIVAVDAQGALAALFAVAQNAGVNTADLDVLALPLRKRSAPALLRTLFSPDMRVANAAKKALRQIIAIASCQNTPWMSTIRSALSLRTATHINRSVQLRNLLTRLADILHLVIRQAASSKTVEVVLVPPHKRSSRSSLGYLINRPRPSLISERRAAERYADGRDRFFLRDIFRRKNLSHSTSRNSSRATIDGEPYHRFIKRRFNKPDLLATHRPLRVDNADDWQSVASGLLSTGGSCPGSIFSSVTESAAASASRSHSHAPRHAGGTVKRDAATAMYIFERLLSKRTNPDLEDRVQVLSTLAEIAVSTFSGQYALTHKIDNPEDYIDAMATVFARHGQKIFSVVLDILFRPVREADANRIGIFSFHEAGIVEVGADPLYTRRKLMMDFPQSAICLPNMDCTLSAAVACNSILKLFLRFVPQLCEQRMALLTGTINSAFLHCSEALVRTPDACKWDTNKINSASDALSVLAVAIPNSVDSALELIIREPVTLRLVIETCIRSVSATGRLLAQNAARYSAPKRSDEGTLDSLRSWQALIKILPGNSSWSGTPSYSSSILFLAQVARRAALIAVVRAHRKDTYIDMKPNHDNNKNKNNNNSTNKLDNAVASETSARVPSTKNNMENEGIDDTANSTASSESYGAGFEIDDETSLSTELQRSVVAMINVPGSSPGDVFFELYRTVVYLYANDLKKQTKASTKTTSTGSAGRRNNNGNTERLGPLSESRTRENKSKTSCGRTQSDEDAKGVLVENIAVDGQLPSRALRRAVMGSELDLGEYFDVGQPPSLQHLSHEYSGVPIGLHTFEEFAHALAVIIGTLWNKMITNNFENPEEAAMMIARDVQRSGSSYLKKVHKRAKIIMKRDLATQEYDWRGAKYDERIKRLEEQVASLKSLVQSSLDGSTQISRRKSVPKILGLTGGGGGIDHVPRADRYDGEEELHEIVCGPSRCFCVG